MSRLALAALGASGFAGLAAALAVASPARQLSAVVSEGRARAAGPAWHRVHAILAGRSDALPISRRLLAGSTATGAMGLAAVRIDQDAASVALPVVFTLSIVSTIALGWVEPRRTRRRRRQLVLDIPQALELLASCLGAGLSLTSATAAVVRAYTGPVREELSTVLKLINLGASEADAWRTLRGDPELGPAAIDLARSAQWGTALMDALHHHARAARQRRQAALQVAARSVGVRSVLPLMTCFLPAFLLIGVVPTVVSAISSALT
ncbi:MAG TPA: type II secretion system F family protein [Propionibacteriaceae bacterium]|nr:type II secretion system F family protein [Propionibacteriaceae bacterium]